MDQNTHKTTVPWLSIGLLTVLLGLAPYVMTFPPHAVAWDTPDSADSIYPLRVILVLFGLIATVVTFAQFLRACHGALSFLSPVPSFAVFFACAVVGWRSFPYWVMGVYQVYIGAFPPRDQDPKSMIPMTWMGEFWRLPVLFLPLVCLVVLPGLAVLAGVFLWRREFVAAGITAGSASVALLFMLAFSPNYMTWLLD